METRRQISRICWAYTAFLAASTAAQLLFGALLELFVLIFGESRAFTRAALLVSEFAMYGIGFPLFAWLMGRIPSCEMKEKKKIRVGQFFGMLVLCYGLTYLGNMIGGLLMEAAGTLKGADYSNPVSDVIGQMDVGMIILTSVIIAPSWKNWYSESIWWIASYRTDRKLQLCFPVCFSDFSMEIFISFFMRQSLARSLPGCTARPDASATILPCIC